MLGSPPVVLCGVFSPSMGFLTLLCHPSCFIYFSFFWRGENRRTVLREVWAHAVLEVQPHIVRYYSAWEEDDKMLIQNEYCDGTGWAFFLFCLE